MRFVLQVVLILDTREQFGRHVGGRQQDGRVAMRDESVRQIANLGVRVEVQTTSPPACFLAPVHTA